MSKPASEAEHLVILPSYEMRVENRRDDERMVYITTFTLVARPPLRFYAVTEKPVSPSAA